MEVTATDTAASQVHLRPLEKEDTETRITDEYQHDDAIRILPTDVTSVPKIDKTYTNPRDV